MRYDPISNTVPPMNASAAAVLVNVVLDRSGKSIGNQTMNPSWKHELDTVRHARHDLLRKPPGSSEREVPLESIWLTVDHPHRRAESECHSDPERDVHHQMRLELLLQALHPQIHRSSGFTSNA
jgi:hypothetical protein